MHESARAGEAAAGRSTFSVGIVALPNFTMLAFAAFVDTLRLAADEGDRSRPINCRWTVVSATQAPVQSSCGTRITPTELLGDPARFDYVVVVGGLLHKGPLADATTLAWLQRAARAGVTLVGLCVGSFVLASAGLMRGRRCCISAYHAHDFARQFPEVTPVTDQWFLPDGDRITCPGGVAAADLAAYLVARHCGPAWARKGLQLAMIAEERPPSHPQPLSIVATPIENTRLQKAVALIEQRLSRPPSLEELADRAHLSTRQLQRLFQREMQCSPHEFSRRVRLRYARWLLRRTDRTVAEIGESCGFRDSAHFCRQFRVFFGISPMQSRLLDRKGTAPPAGPLPWRPEPDLHTLQPALTA